MAKKKPQTPSKRRLKIKDLPESEQNLDKKQMKKVKGGAIESGTSLAGGQCNRTAVGPCNRTVVGPCNRTISTTIKQ